MLNFRTTLEDQTDNKGTFVLEPLGRGFGHTVGNVLRRVLLSALEGSAISSVKISGVQHQFSTLPGVSEDVIEIILNLKKVRIRLFSDSIARISLRSSGKGEVKAKDIDMLGTGEIINPEAHIASLNSPSAKLHIEMTAEKGVGYVTADEKKISEIGVLPIDSIFSPVVEVSYKVAPTRVGRSANYDKLILEIMTDGTTTPEEALQQASRVLAGYFKQIYYPTLDEEIPTEAAVTNGALRLSVEELDLPVRITNALKVIEIDTVEKLVATPKTQLMKAKNLGVQSIKLISDKLEERGLSLSEA